jgi:hypothetical protein
MPFYTSHIRMELLVILDAGCLSALKRSHRLLYPSSAPFSQCVLVVVRSPFQYAFQRTCVYHFLAFFTGSPKLNFWEWFFSLPFYLRSRFVNSFEELSRMGILVPHEQGYALSISAFKAVASVVLRCSLIADTDARSTRPNKRRKIR